MLNKKVSAVVLILALFFKCSIARSESIHVVSKQANIDITTEKEIADALDKADEKYRQINSKAMHLSLEEYDANADAQRAWSAAMLYFIGYLNGIATIDAGPTL